MLKLAYLVYYVLVMSILSSLDIQTVSSCVLDVVFIVDSSGSINIKNYNTEKQFVLQTAKYLEIPEKNDGAVIIFSSSAQLSIQFGTSANYSTFKSSVEQIPYLKGTTRIDKALSLAVTKAIPMARQHVKKIAMVLTDGTQDNHATPLREASQPLRDIGVRVIAVGIGRNIDTVELRQMVEYSSDMVVVPDFPSLTKKVKDISDYLCGISSTSGGTTVVPSTMAYKPRTTWSYINHTGNPCITEGSSELVKWFVQSLDLLDYRVHQSLENSTNLLAEFMANLNRSTNPISRSEVMCCLSVLEAFFFRYAENFLQSLFTNGINLNTKIIEFNAQRVNMSTDYVFSRSNLSQYESAVMIPKEIFKRNAIVISIIYKDLHLYLQGKSSNSTNKKLGTNILSVTVKPKTYEHLERNVTLRFKPLFGTSPQTKPDCVFWDYSKGFENEERHQDVEVRGVTNSSGWSSEGCSLVKNSKQRIECTCNHLTHFAVLMEIDGEKQISASDQAVLSVITYIGIGISLLGCLLTIILHFAFVNIKAQLSQIHVNLVIAIAIGQIIFVAGIDSTENMVGCVCVAGLIQYFYLVAFCWMLIEGIQLYLRIVKVFNSEHSMTINYIFAWGFPLIVVATAIGVSSTSNEGISGFVHSKFCWLSFKNKVAWTFVGPVLVITLINVILLLHVIREMTRMDKAMVGLTPQLDIVRYGR